MSILLKYGISRKNGFLFFSASVCLLTVHWGLGINANENPGVARVNQHWGGECSEIFLTTKSNFWIFGGVTLFLLTNARKFPDLLSKKQEIFEDWGGVTPPIAPRSRHPCENRTLKNLYVSALIFFCWSFMNT